MKNFKIDEKKDTYRDKYWKQSKILNLKQPFLIISAPRSKVEKQALAEVTSEIEQATGKSLRIIIDPILK